MKRALIVLRLSRDSDASSSIERQREATTAECERRGWVVVGEAVDVDVSGKVDPFRRPELGAWLAEPHRFDAIVAQKMDRLTRDSYGKEILGRWAQENGVTILAEGQEYDSLAAGVLALVAQGELRKISERNKEAYDRNLLAGNYRGGHTPFGYKAVKVGNAWRLVIDADESKVIKDIASRIISGEPVARIAESLNRDGVPTTKDRARIRAGKEPNGHRWTTSNLIRMLSQETLLGYAVQSDVVTNGRGVVVTKTSKQGRTRKELSRDKRVVIGTNGLPVRRADPVLTESEFRKVQAALSLRRGTAPKRRVRGVALLLQVIFCALCGRPMYAFHTNSGREGEHRAYYRCSSMLDRPACGNRSARLPEMDELVTNGLLAMIGAYPNVRRVYVPGSDNTDQIAEIDRQLDGIRRGMAVFVGDQLDRLLAPVPDLNAR
ncbi:recombinase family protein, partial [Pseudonocardia hydrocarbonoxydans]